ncbi:MAG: hypothetical protein IJX75_02660 [Clostridia bacterium]|nr:hypothetical protein [Clostridia bacterium]
MLYVVIICFCALVISIIITLACNVGFLYALGVTALAVAIVVLLDALVATCARLLPKSCADYTKQCFSVSNKEKKFYEKLKIRKWKDRIPEIGHFTGFRKNKLDDPKNVEYVDRFLLECCYGEIGHFFSAFFGFFLLLFFFITDIWIAIALPVAIINGLLNLPSLFILRYNSYKLKILRKSLVKKQA